MGVALKWVCLLHESMLVISLHSMDFQGIILYDLWTNSPSLDVFPICILLLSPTLSMAVCMLEALTTASNKLLHATVLSIKYCDVQYMHTTQAYMQFIYM